MERITAISAHKRTEEALKDEQKLDTLMGSIYQKIREAAEEGRDYLIIDSPNSNQTHQLKIDGYHISRDYNADPYVSLGIIVRW